MIPYTLDTITNSPEGHQLLTQDIYIYIYTYIYMIDFNGEDTITSKGSFG